MITVEQYMDSDKCGGTFYRTGTMWSGMLWRSLVWYMHDKHLIQLSERKR